MIRFNRNGGGNKYVLLGSRSRHAIPETKPVFRAGLFMLLWLAGAVAIFALLYTTSQIALLTLPTQEGIQMGSRLAADYSVWEVLEFQPVDPAIIEEIQAERDLSGPLIVDDPGRATAVGSVPTPSFTEGTENPAIQATLEQTPVAPVETQPFITPTPVPTDADLLPTSTETPPASQPRPTKTRKPHKTPKPPRPSKSE